MKPTPRNAANTIVPAYLALLERVLLVSRETSLMTDSGGLWIAENSNHQFKADDWVTLLGLVALQETRGPNWPASDQQFEQFLSQFGVP